MKDNKFVHNTLPWDVDNIQLSDSEFVTEDTYEFSDRNGNAMLTLKGTGEILVRGRLAATDKEVVDVLKEFVKLTHSYKR